jgi:hypothetical protein
LNISPGRVYISRDVVFDENIFPFANLHCNAGSRLQSEILLLPPDLVNFSRDMNNSVYPMANTSRELLQSCQDSTPGTSLEHEQLSSSTSGEEPVVIQVFPNSTHGPFPFGINDASTPIEMDSRALGSSDQEADLPVQLETAPASPSAPSHTLTPIPVSSILVPDSSVVQAPVSPPASGSFTPPAPQRFWCV